MGKGMFNKGYNIEFKEVKDGEWVQPIRHGYQMACCDCGLVHELHFRLVKYGNNKHKIQFQAFRDDVVTEIERKKRNIKVRTK